LENIFNILPEFIFKSKNSVLIKIIKEIKMGIIDIDIKYISDLKGQFLSNPLLSLSLSICLFSMAGKKNYMLSALLFIIKIIKKCHYILEINKLTNIFINIKNLITSR